MSGGRPYSTLMKSRITVSRSRADGFTLIELMMVLVLLAILLGVGGTSFRDAVQRNRLQSTLSEMAAAMSFARGEAVVRTQPVSLCPTTDNITCGGAAWETGYLIFVDDGTGAGGAAGDGARSAGEELLRIGEPAGDGVSVRSLGFSSINNMIFQADGRIQQNLRGTLTICDARGADEARGLVVEVSGQARLAVDTDGNDTLEDHTTTALVCP